MQRLIQSFIQGGAGGSLRFRQTSINFRLMQSPPGIDSEGHPEQQPLYELIKP